MNTAKALGVVVLLAVAALAWAAAPPAPAPVRLTAEQQTLVRSACNASAA